MSITNNGTHRPVLVDGNSLMTRCIMAAAKDDLRAGTWTGGLSAFVSSLSMVLIQLELARTPASGIFVFFDAGVPDERMAAIPEYKQNRADKHSFLSEDEEQEAFEQMTEIMDALPKFGAVPLLFRQREADDCVAAAAQVCARAGYSPVVVTGDRDLFQTVLYGASVWYLSTKEFITADNFEEMVAKHFKCHEGVSAGSYVMFRALSGDKSDGISGVPGVGPVRAAALITEAAAHSGNTFHEESPERQMVLIADYMAKAEDPPSYYSTVSAHVSRILDIIHGIDLRSSFGGTKSLQALMQATTTYDSQAVLKWAVRHKLNNLITDPSRYLKPFARASTRRVVL